MSIVPQRPIGRAGLVASAQGLGCMGMTAFYGDFDPVAAEPESLKTIGRALELGINFLDTAWIYQSMGPNGLNTNEELVGKALKLYGREKFVVATKFGIGFTAEMQRIVSGKPEFIRQQLAQSLQRLGTDYIDLYYMHRMDPSTPIEETMGELKKLVEEGKIRYVGLSECTIDELRRAHAVHPITAIQMEWSLQTRDIEDTILPVARELGVAVVAYSPLGRGFLADLAAMDSLSEKDWRRTLPRFSGENYEKNKELVQHFFALAQQKGCSPAQLALAWVHAQGEDVFPIPGTKSASRIEENAKAFSVLSSLTAEEIREVEKSVAGVVGDRYTGDQMKSTFNRRQEESL